MANLFQIFTVFLAGLAVGIADAFIKKAADTGTFLASWTSPWMLAAVLLYIGQITIFVYVFFKHWKLGIVSNVQIVFFSITAVLIGYFFFGETLSTRQMLGVGLAIGGVVLMNL